MGWGCVQVEICWNHSLKATGFKLFTLEHHSWFQKLLFKCNLRRYNGDSDDSMGRGGAAIFGGGGGGGGGGGDDGGAVHVAFS
jgi:uncharacterized membrane protein YgcG